MKKSALICSACALLCAGLWVGTHAVVAATTDEADAESAAQAIPESPPESSETLRSRALEAQLALTDKDTTAVWLGSGNGLFLALYRPDTSGNPFINVIILHDNQQNPDWPALVEPLRTELSRQGWNTLSIAVPAFRLEEEIPTLPTQSSEAEAVLQDEADAADNPESATEPTTEASEASDSPAVKNDGVSAEELPAELGRRVQIALQYLAGQPAQPTVLIALGSSANIAANLSLAGQLGSISGIIMIDPASVPILKAYDENLRNLDPQIPMLDLVPEINARLPYGSRARAARKARNKLYTQRVMKGSNREFQGMEPYLIKTIRGWAERQFKP